MMIYDWNRRYMPYHNKEIITVMLFNEDSTSTGLLMKLLAKCICGHKAGRHMLDRPRRCSNKGCDCIRLRERTFESVVEEL